MKRKFHTDYLQNHKCNHSNHRHLHHCCVVLAAVVAVLAMFLLDQIHRNVFASRDYLIHRMHYLWLQHHENSGVTYSVNYQVVCGDKYHAKFQWNTKLHYFLYEILHKFTTPFKYHTIKQRNYRRQKCFTKIFNIIKSFCLFNRLRKPISFSE